MVKQAFLQALDRMTIRVHGPYHHGSVVDGHGLVKGEAHVLHRVRGRPVVVGHLDLEVRRRQDAGPG